jgi:hypothetical protein
MFLLSKLKFLPKKIKRKNVPSYYSLLLLLNIPFLGYYFNAGRAGKLVFPDAMSGNRQNSLIKATYLYMKTYFCSANY